MAQNFDEEPLQLADLSKVNYSAFLLLNNPFPSVEVPGAVPLTTADRKDILEHFKRALSTTVFDNMSSITVLIGEYGSGKTHLLKYFQYVVNKELLTSRNKVLAIYVKSVGRNFRDLYLYFIDDVGRELLKDLAYDLIKSYFSKIGHDGIKKYGVGGELSEYHDLTKLPIEVILPRSKFYDIFYDIVKSLPKLRKNSTAYALLHLAHPDYSSLAWRWLIGENLSSDERKVIRVEENISDYIVAEAILNDLMTLFSQVEIKTVVLLIDEFENFTLMPRNFRDKFMDGLRHFIDDNPQGVLLAFTTTPFAWNELTEVTSALIRRLVGNEYELKFFSESDTRELIIRYLKLFRIKDKHLPKKVENLDTDINIYPFTESAISKIQEESKGLVSTIIKIARRAIDVAIDSNLPVIDEKIIEKLSV